MHFCNDALAARGLSFSRHIVTLAISWLLLFPSMGAAMTWEAPRLVNSDGATDSGQSAGDYAPQVVSGRNGTSVAVWSNAKGPGAYVDPVCLAMSRSTNTGVTWSAPVFLNGATSFARATGEDADCSIATDGQGRWAVVWATQQEQIFIVRSTDDAQTWTAPTLLATSFTGINEMPRIATNDDGNWVVIWRHGPPNFAGFATVLISRSSNHGVSWTSPVEIPGITAVGGANCPALSCDKRGNLVLAARFAEYEMFGCNNNRSIMFMHSGDIGVSWSQPQIFRTSVPIRKETDEEPFPQIANDQRGNWIATWHEFAHDGCNFVGSSIMCSRSSGNGSVWSSPTPIGDVITGDSAYDMHPEIDTDRNGTWVLAWQTWYNSPRAPRYSVSTDNGASWTPWAVANTWDVTHPVVSATYRGVWLLGIESPSHPSYGIDSDIYVTRSVINDESCYAAPLTCGIPVTGALTQNRTDSGAVSCGNVTGPDAWYYVDVPAAGTYVSASFAHGSTQGSVSLHTGATCAATTQQACGYNLSQNGTASISWNTTAANQRVYIRVRAPYVATQTLTVTLTQPAQGWTRHVSHTFNTTTQNWVQSGTTNSYIGVAYDSGAGALRVNVTGGAPTGTDTRVAGWRTDFFSPDLLSYSSVGTGNFVRAKFWIHSNHATSSNFNQIPNLRLRVANRFAQTAHFQLTHHSNSHPDTNYFGEELRPSRNASAPSLYRVDYDPIDVPYLVQNAATEKIWRSFEAYVDEPQEQGSLFLTEASVGVFPSSLLSDCGPPAKVLATGTTDAGDLKYMSNNSMGPLVITKFDQNFKNGVQQPITSTELRYTEGPQGVTLDSTSLDKNLNGIIAREFVVGPEQTKVRVQEGKQYKVRFHVTSTRNSDVQSMMRLRVRSAAFAWSMGLEIGGAKNSSIENRTLASQVLPGVGSQNPDKLAGESNGGWYTVLFHSPLSKQVRTDKPDGTLYAPGDSLAVRMPKLSTLPGPGSTSFSRRDVDFGIDLFDSLTDYWIVNDPDHNDESGNFTIDRIEVREYNLVDDAVPQ